jgi:hypothetical protein
MSAYLTGEKEINIVVNAMTMESIKHFVKYNEIEIGHHGSRRSVFKILVDENVKSLKSRYPKADPKDFGDYEHYRYSSLPVIDIPKAFGAVLEYEYQSGEHPDWEKSLAYQFCNRLFRSLGQQIARPENEEREKTTHPFYTN